MGLAVAVGYGSMPGCCCLGLRSLPLLATVSFPLLFVVQGFGIKLPDFGMHEHPEASSAAGRAHPLLCAFLETALRSRAQASA
jgi:hypothetical protein